MLVRIKQHAFSIGLLAVLIVGGSVGLSVYKSAWAASHDLDVIGAGKPVVVQVHDPKCPKCRKLMSNTKIALKKHADEILFRIADLETSDGQKFSRDHDVEKITLVLFDSRGQRRSVLSGVKSTEMLGKEFDRLALGK